MQEEKSVDRSGGNDRCAINYKSETYQSVFCIRPVAQRDSVSRNRNSVHVGLTSEHKVALEDGDSFATVHVFQQQQPAILRHRLTPIKFILFCCVVYLACNHIR